MSLRHRFGAAAIVTSLLVVPIVGAQSGGAAPASAAAPIDWRSAESGTLERQTQLTFPDRFLKAGEAYFSPDGRRVIFQAVEVPAGGADPEDFYAMFVADLVTGDEPRWRLDNVRRVSPRGSANTCGWFHPADPNLVIFGSTIGPPTASEPPGFQRGTSRYRWSFPPEMRVVQADLRELPTISLGSGDDVPASALRVLAGDGTGYTAECTLSNDGRTLLYCARGSREGDLFVMDLASGAITPLISAPGYDGGPFFSPNGDRICYRSDRAGNNLLQIFVADLARDESGRVTGASREYALTANGDVNWCPYWHPGGRHLAYATSAISHRNYEIFFVDAANEPGATPPQSRYGTNPRRITNADGADVLPAFDSTGKLMMWTSQRAPDRSSQLWIADFVMPLDAARADAAERGSERGASR
ncbi:MAG: hypothetical protein FJ253_00245 [Phycisphaerae bacterium]|nr:hypothetical protein [Phycisphaerae bacterium]